jgi:hypothetical protein
MPREWLKVTGANTLGGLIGAWGIKSGNFPDPADLLAFAREVFNIPTEIKCCQRAAEYVYKLPRDERRRLGKAAVERHPELTQKNLRRTAQGKTSEKRLATPQKSFYQSWEWKKLRYEVLKERGGKCQCCGATLENGARIVVDHIKPIRHFWHLRFDKTNCQVLCNDCNMGKASDDMTDWGAANIVPFPNVNGA